MTNDESFAPTVKTRPLLVLSALLLIVATAAAVPLVHPRDTWPFVTAFLLHGLIYLVAILLVIRRPGGWGTVAIILVTAVGLRAVSMTALPDLTTDALRYVWDGRLGWEGVSPYLYPPADERLAHLRDSEIYPGINQKETAVTIYPPMAQLVFMAGVAIYDGIGGMKAIMFAFELLILLGLVGWLRAEGLPISRVAIYAWHPLPIWEFSSQAHIDAAATGFLVLGIWAAVCRRQGLTGVLFAGAALVKYFPLVLLPALWRRWDWKLPVALFASMGLLYLPYVLTAGTGVFGFLGKHLDNEGYQSGWGFHVIWYLRDFQLADPPGWLYAIAALVTILTLAAFSVFVRQADAFHPKRMVLLGAAFVFLISPHYPWYFAFLCALMVRVAHPALFAMTLFCVTLYLPRINGISWSELYAVTYVLPLVVWIGWEVACRMRPEIAELDNRLTPRPDPAKTL